MQPPEPAADPAVADPVVPPAAASEVSTASRLMCSLVLIWKHCEVVSYSRRSVAERRGHRLEPGPDGLEKM